MSAEPGSLYNLYRDLIHLRNDHAALRHGEYIPVESSHGAVFAFLRHTAGETLLVVVNTSDAAVSDYGLSLGSSALRGRHQAEELLHGAEASRLRLNGQGGFRGYEPVGSLAPHTGYVVHLSR